MRCGGWTGGGGIGESPANFDVDGEEGLREKM